MEEEVPSGSDNIVTEFNTYEDFLDSQITSLDLYYLEVSMNYTKWKTAWWFHMLMGNISVLMLSSPLQQQQLGHQLRKNVTLYEHMVQVQVSIKGFWYMLKYEYAP